MALPAGQPTAHLPVARLGAWMMGAAAAAAVVGTAVMSPFAEGAVRAGALAGIAVAAGTGVGLAALGVTGGGIRPVVAWAGLVIAGSVVRMGVAVAAAVGLFLWAHPEKGVFWGVFLAAAVAVLLVETRVVAPVLRGAGRNVGSAGAEKALP